MKLYIYTLFILIIFSCENKAQTKNEDFFSYETSKFRGTRKIVDLHARFSECGEWGGHEENILITTRKDENFHLYYEKYSVNCDSMVLVEDSIGTYNEPFNKLVDSCTIIMTETHKSAIIRFAHNLLSSKFREEFSGHAGDSFYFKKHEGFSGNGFIIDFYGFDNKILKDYKQLISELNLPISEVKNNNERYKD